MIVLVQPETGDELQWEKAGQLEIADIVVVHKADLPSADRTLSQLRELLNLPGCRPVPVMRVSSNRGLGVEELWAAIKSCPMQGRLDADLMSPRNAFVAFWEGEPSGEPRHPIY